MGDSGECDYAGMDELQAQVEAHNERVLQAELAQHLEDAAHSIHLAQCCIDDLRTTIDRTPVEPAGQ